MIGSYVCDLNSELFLHIDKNHSFFLVLETNKCKKTFAFLLCICSCLLSIFLHRFRNELACSLRNGSYFSSYGIILCFINNKVNICNSNMTVLMYESYCYHFSNICVVLGFIYLLCKTYQLMLLLH